MQNGVKMCFSYLPELSRMGKAPSSLPLLPALAGWMLQCLRQGLSLRTSSSEPAKMVCEETTVSKKPWSVQSTFASATSREHPMHGESSRGVGDECDTSRCLARSKTSVESRSLCSIRDGEGLSSLARSCSLARREMMLGG